MKAIKLPRLERLIFHESGNKNVIKQLIATERSIPTSSIEVFENGLVVSYEDKNYFLTSDENSIPADKEYVILTNKKPTIKNISNGIVTSKKWIKHPQMSSCEPINVSNSWKGKFNFIEEDPSTKKEGLRGPQLGALYALLGHLRFPSDSAIVVLPTGTGKTETMLSTLVAGQCSKLLVTVPSDFLREQIFSKFLTLGLLKQFKVIEADALNPIVGIVKNRFSSAEDLESFFSKCNVIITTMSLLTSCSVDDQEKMAKLSSHVFIDEAHHVKAASWNDFKNKFPKEKVIQFTATPFRNDGKRLDGKILFNFPLKIAQKEGYFSKIDFIAIREYDLEKGDKSIADAAVKKLREDRINKNHILMARCNSKERANQIFKLYEPHTDLNPVVIYSGAPNAKKTYEKIIKKEAKIIVCVDMLGEGFDLPELKIAAFHDIRKSLPITLQLAGRFTRTKFDEELGNASFIANIADLDVRAELADLYSRDADWNQILSDTSYSKIEDEIKFKNFMEGFSKLKDSNIPFQNIRPKLSTVVYKNKTGTWFPSNFQAGLEGYDDLEFKFADINSDEKLIVIITAKKQDVEWINNKDIYEVDWNMTVVFWETKNDLLFINSSDNSSLYGELAQAIIGEDAELIKGINVFKAFYNIQRVKLQNVGLKQYLGKNIRFRMMVGTDIGEALSIAEKQKGEKSFVMGVGFENAKPVNIGTSSKGRIWNKMAGDLKLFKKWCTELGEKISNDSIDPNQILKETLIPELISNIPKTFPVWIDWDIDLYINTETKVKFVIDGIASDLSSTDLRLVSPSGGGDLLFSIKTDQTEVVFKIELFENTSGDTPYPDFKILRMSQENVQVIIGRRSMDSISFFESYIPTIWFADGSALTGNEYIQIRQSISNYPSSEIQTMDWSGIDLSKEAQDVFPKITDSIQYKIIQILINEDNDIVYDDDYSGEIADVVAIKLLQEKLVIKLFHLKYAINGAPSSQIKNFYEVCGQAQKSVHWKHKSGREFFNHLLRRETKSYMGKSCSRLEKGEKKDLERLLSIAKNEIPIEFEVYIVQPGLSKQKVTDEILTLLGVTKNYLKEIAGIDLKVIASE